MFDTWAPAAKHGLTCVPLSLTSPMSGEVKYLDRSGYMLNAGYRNTSSEFMETCVSAKWAYTLGNAEPCWKEMADWCCIRGTVCHGGHRLNCGRTAMHMLASRDESGFYIWPCSFCWFYEIPLGIRRMQQLRTPKRSSAKTLHFGDIWSGQRRHYKNRCFD